MNSKVLKCLSFPYREAENTIGSDQTQVHSVNGEVVMAKICCEFLLTEYCSGEMAHRGAGFTML